MFLLDIAAKLRLSVFLSRCPDLVLGTIEVSGFIIKNLRCPDFVLRAF